MTYGAWYEAEEKFRRCGDLRLPSRPKGILVFHTQQIRANRPLQIARVRRVAAPRLFTAALLLASAVLVWEAPAVLSPSFDSGSSHPSATPDIVSELPVQLTSSASDINLTGFLEDCGRTDNPTVNGYATGSECPPEGFPYEPEVKMTKAGMRAMDPYTDGCSHMRDTGPTWNFKNACATHDYLADLQRFGAKGVPEPGIDNQLMLDALADCKGRNIIARGNCQAVARGVRAGVQQGNYATGDKINDGN
jgi:hypothetical protein